MIKKTVKWYRPVERCPKRDQQEVLFVPYSDGIMYKGIYNLDERTFALSSDYYHTYAPGAIAYWTPFPLTSPMRKENKK